MKKMMFHYSDSKEQKKFQITVKLSTNCQLFFWSSDIPEEIHAVQDVPHYKRQHCFDMWSEVEEFVQDLIDQYEATFIEETRKKVICYMVSPESGSHNSEYLSLAYRVLDKVELGDEVIYQEQERKKWKHGASIDMRVVHTIFQDTDVDQDHKEMLWTEKREKFFESITASLQELGKRLRTGLKKRPELLAKQIESGALRLMIPKGGADDE